ncbi:MAG TPA: xanthine phosphoribosyltransferase [Alphaproteobacteria bacterium]|mgnify:CR=1 FL=1|nr:xanthine phosphoribosyltransferase [Rhodospirillaceae bacterium]HRJ12956.1 xanthine phosphoribosyltransferase [Alphaproteobacteria bacterium]
MTYTKLHVSWEEAAALAEKLAEQLMPRRDEFRTIIAITRGGMVPATIIARRLDIKYVDTVGISSYEDKVQGEVQVIKTIPGNGEGCLVIDDLVDKGTTAQVVRQMLPKSVIAVLYAKPSGKPFADIAVKDIPQDVWIEFPWE